MGFLQEYGSKVAYQIRFETSKAPDTRILFLTEVRCFPLLCCLIAHTRVVRISGERERRDCKLNCLFSKRGCSCDR